MDRIRFATLVVSTLSTPEWWCIRAGLEMSQIHFGGAQLVHGLNRIENVNVSIFSFKQC